MRLDYILALKMEAACSFKTSGCLQTTCPYNSDDRTVHTQRPKNSESRIVYIECVSDNGECYYSLMLMYDLYC
jgi:hypothetical protein